MQTQDQSKDNKQETIKKTDTPKSVEAAHKQAEKDIAQDADLSIHNPNDDLDEAETARLGNDKNDLGGIL